MLGLLLLLGAAGQAMEASILIPPCLARLGGLQPAEAAAQSVFEDSTDWSHDVVQWPELRPVALLAAPVPRVVDPSQLARCWPDGAL